MKSIELCLSLGYMSYVLRISTKFTFLRGLSGSGKTTVGDLINAVKTNSTEIKYISEGYRFSELMLLPYLSKEDLLEHLLKKEGNLYFIDEDYPYIDDSLVIDSLFKSRNYFIIVTRDRGFKGYIHDVNSFKSIKTEYDDYYVLSHISDYYEDSSKYCYLNDYTIVTEDKGNLPNVINSYTKIKAVPSSGVNNIKDTIYGVLNEIGEEVVCIADSSRFEDELCNIQFKLRNSSFKCVLILLHSSEQVLLSLLDDSNNDVVENPVEYIDFSVFETYEDFFVALIKDKFKSIGYNYSKNLNNISLFKDRINLFLNFLFSKVGDNKRYNPIEILNIKSQPNIKYDSKVIYADSTIGFNIPHLKGFKEIVDLIDDEFERVYHGKLKMYGVFDIYKNGHIIVFVGSKFSFVVDLSSDKYTCCNCDDKLASNFMFYLKESKLISL